MFIFGLKFEHYRTLWITQGKKNIILGLERGSMINHDLVFIFAGDYEEGEDCIDKLRYDLEGKKYIHLSGPHLICGCKDFTVIRYGKFSQREDRESIETEILLRSIVGDVQVVDMLQHGN